MTVLGRLVLGRYTGVLVALVAVGVYLTITEDVFLTWDNLMNIGKSNSVVFVLAIGATFVIISGGHRPLDRVGGDRRGDDPRAHHGRRLEHRPGAGGDRALRPLSSASSTGS